MEILKEIAYTLSRYQVRQVDVISNPDTKPSKKDSRYWKAYLGLRENPWENEADFAQDLGFEHTGKNYNRFKNELKDRLWNTLLFTENTAFDPADYGAVYSKLLQKWAVTEVLKQRGAYKAFRELANECLTTALKYDMVKLVVDVSTSLKGNSFLSPNLKKDFQRAQGVFETYWPIYLAEVNIRNAYEAFIVEFAQSKGYKKQYAAAAISIVQTFQADALKIDTLQFQFHFRLIHFYSKALCHDWTNALKIAEDALGFFGAKNFKATPQLIAFYHQKVACLIMLERYDEAKSTLDASLSLTNPDSSNHFKNRELATIVAMYAEDYTEAWKLCKSAMQQDRFCKIPAIDQEAWRIYYGYLYFLVHTDRFELSPREKGELTKLRLSSWLNDLPLHSLDKRGAQIPVLILQIFLLITEKRWDSLEHRIEALRKFRQRNLDPTDEHFRTTCFIQLLELIPKFGYDVQSLQEAAGPLLKKLSLTVSDMLDRTYEIEVVPYERQWRWVLEAVAQSNLSKSVKFPNSRTLAA